MLFFVFCPIYKIKYINLYVYNKHKIIRPVKQAVDTSLDPMHSEI